MQSGNEKGQRNSPFESVWNHEVWIVMDGQKNKSLILIGCLLFGILFAAGKSSKISDHFFWKFQTETHFFFIYSHFLKRDIQNDSVKTWIRSNRYALYLLKSRIQMKDVVFPSNLKNSISSGFYIWIDSIWIFKKTKIFILVRLNFFIIFERILLFQTHNLLDYTDES